MNSVEILVGQKAQCPNRTVLEQYEQCVEAIGAAMRQLCPTCPIDAMAQVLASCLLGTLKIWSTESTDQRMQVNAVHQSCETNIVHPLIELLGDDEGESRVRNGIGAMLPTITKLQSTYPPDAIARALATCLLQTFGVWSQHPDSPALGVNVAYLRRATHLILPLFLLVEDCQSLGVWAKN